MTARGRLEATLDLNPAAAPFGACLEALQEGGVDQRPGGAVRQAGDPHDAPLLQQHRRRLRVHVVVQAPQQRLSAAGTYAQQTQAVAGMLEQRQALPSARDMRRFAGMA